MSEQAVIWRGPWLIKYFEIQTKDKTMWKRIARHLRYMWKMTKQSFIISYLMNRRRIHQRNVSCLVCLPERWTMFQTVVHSWINHSCQIKQKILMNSWCHTTGQKNNNPAPASSHTPYYEGDFFYNPIVNHLYLLSIHLNVYVCFWSLLTFF